ncbi:PPOX class F420-dependent oxidoreductase [Microlunatus panaciterrae]|uniref:PPOX class probable F420-dependent enzyme n=1 Tax=Microlunatus panaciterrae TaxID=400768 RepID=A0ABS2RN95_9ACTN|nr:PPOX class F420-dependent oxidoreductase [Microlunatus panaciterrae]MBM7800052.1 PPOX class probable F420-dependent enzyme [Microlunatus panaciterrae]
MLADPFRQLLAASHHGVLVTLKRDGRPQISNVAHSYDPVGDRIRVSITDDRAKTRNLRRDPRVSFYVTSPDFWSYAVAEGNADLTPVAAEPDDPTVEELIEVYRSIGGEHPNWDEFRAAMVAEQRLVLRIRVDHLYGMVRPT